MGFKELGANRIISFGASGGISPNDPGTIVILDQIIDLTVAGYNLLSRGRGVIM